MPTKVVLVLLFASCMLFACNNPANDVAKEYCACLEEKQSKIKEYNSIITEFNVCQAKFTEDLKKLSQDYEKGSEQNKANLVDAYAKGMECFKDANEKALEKLEKK